MLAISPHDPSTEQMGNGLKTTAMGLGLIRLLLDARRTEEAKKMLCFLQHDLPRLEEVKTTSQTCKAKDASRSLSLCP
jgi:hypothetical protein